VDWRSWSDAGTAADGWRCDAVVCPGRKLTSCRGSTARLAPHSASSAARRPMGRCDRPSMTGGTACSGYGRSCRGYDAGGLFSFPGESERNGGGICGEGGVSVLVREVLAAALPITSSGNALSGRIRWWRRNRGSGRVQPYGISRKTIPNQPSNTPTLHPHVLQSSLARPGLAPHGERHGVTDWPVHSPRPAARHIPTRHRTPGRRSPHNPAMLIEGRGRCL